LCSLLFEAFTIRKKVEAITTASKENPEDEVKVQRFFNSIFAPFQRSSETLGSKYPLYRSGRYQCFVSRVASQYIDWKVCSDNSSHEMCTRVKRSAAHADSGVPFPPPQAQWHLKLQNDSGINRGGDDIGGSRRLKLVVNCAYLLNENKVLAFTKESSDRIQEYFGKLHKAQLYKMFENLHTRFDESTFITRPIQQKYELCRRVCPILMQCKLTDASETDEETSSDSDAKVIEFPYNDAFAWNFDTSLLIGTPSYKKKLEDFLSIMHPALHYAFRVPVWYRFKPPEPKTKKRKGRVPAEKKSTVIACKQCNFKYLSPVNGRDVPCPQCSVQKKLELERATKDFRQLFTDAERVFDNVESYDRTVRKDVLFLNKTKEEVAQLEAKSQKTVETINEIVLTVRKAVNSANTKSLDGEKAKEHSENLHKARDTLEAHLQQAKGIHAQVKCLVDLSNTTPAGKGDRVAQVQEHFQSIKNFKAKIEDIKKNFDRAVTVYNSANHDYDSDEASQILSTALSDRQTIDGYVKDMSAIGSQAREIVSDVKDDKVCAERYSGKMDQFDMDKIVNDAKEVAKNAKTASSLLNQVSRLQRNLQSNLANNQPKTKRRRRY